MSSATGFYYVVTVTKSNDSSLCCLEGLWGYLTTGRNPLSGTEIFFFNNLWFLKVLSIYTRYLCSNSILKFYCKLSYNIVCFYRLYQIFLILVNPPNPLQSHILLPHPVFETTNLQYFPPTCLISHVFYYPLHLLMSLPLTLLKNLSWIPYLWRHFAVKIPTTSSL